MNRLQRTRLAAYGLLVEEGRILLARLSNTEKEVGKWTLPGGGIDFGEHPLDAVVREFREESGLRVRVQEIVHVDSELLELPNSDLHAVRVIYKVEKMEGELTVEVGGSTDLVQYFSKEEANRLVLVPLASLGVHLAFRNT
ncbi:MAG: NUDIX domain-containing protein [Armatimonadetes bacterium]|nr:NUDIX domain-containing protein [Armatimonadota bacterium]